MASQMMERSVDRFLAPRTRTEEDDEMDDFLEKAKEIEEKIRAIKEGRIPLEELQRQEAEEKRKKAEEERIRKKQKAEYAAREAKRIEKEKKEEHETWWRGAEFMFEEETTVMENEEDVDPMQKYENDYSRWAEERWSGKDPASKAESEEAEAEKTKKENLAFEKANPEFCNNFMEDQKRRQASIQKKAETAMTTRLKGNKAFQRKQFDTALKLYRESLEAKPYEATTLLNIAQVYLKKGDFDDAVEFTTRALKVCSKTNLEFRAKVLSRRALAHENLGDLGSAESDLREAYGTPSGKKNSAIVKQLAAILRKRSDAQREANVTAKVDDDVVFKEEDDDSDDVLLATLRKTLASEDWNKENNQNFDKLLASAAKASEQDTLGVVKRGLVDDSKESLLKYGAALRCSADARVLCRVNGGVKLLCEKVGGTPLPETGAASIGNDGAFDLADCATEEQSEASGSSMALLLGALSGALTSEPKSKEVAVDYGIVGVARDCLLSSGDDDVVLAALEILAELVSLEDGSEKAARAVAKDHALVQAIVHRMTPPTEKKNICLAIVATSVRGLRDLAARDAGLPKQFLKEAVPLTAASLGYFTSWLASEKALDGAIAGEGVESAAASLAQLACFEEARPLFGLAVQGMTASGALLQVARDSKVPASARSKALAALTNACLDDSAMLAAEKNGGVAVAFELVCGKATNQVRARASQLLARLVAGNGESSAAQTLRASPKALPLLIKAIHNAHQVKDDEWADIERDALIRAIAGASSKAKESVTFALLNAGAYEMLISVLPPPRTDLGEVTAMSVSLPPNPKDRIPPATAANLVKAVIAGFSTTELQKDLVTQLRSAGTIERLVAAFANFSELPVRRNLAVLLAKIIAVDPTAKDVARELRGMEMLTTLGKALL